MITYVPNNYHCSYVVAPMCHWHPNVIDPRACSQLGTESGFWQKPDGAPTLADLARWPQTSPNGKPDGPIQIEMRTHTDPHAIMGPWH